MSRSRCVVVATVSFALIGISGCIKREADGGTAVYRMENWIIAATALGGILAAPAGWALRKRSARFGWALLILGPLAVVFLVPAMLAERVKVDADHFERTALPGQDKHDIKFDDLAGIEYKTEQSFSGRRRTTKHVFILTYKQKPPERLTLGTLLQAAAPEIAERARAKGVMVQGID
jgi:hypothetical protein